SLAAKPHRGSSRSHAPDCLRVPRPLPSAAAQSSTAGATAMERSSFVLLRKPPRIAIGVLGEEGHVLIQDLHTLCRAHDPGLNLGAYELAHTSMKIVREVLNLSQHVLHGRSGNDLLDPEPTGFLGVGVHVRLRDPAE